MNGIFIKLKINLFTIYDMIFPLQYFALVSNVHDMMKRKYSRMNHKKKYTNQKSGGKAPTQHGIHNHRIGKKK